jgi:dethiobiotin synthetase
MTLNSMKPIFVTGIGTGIGKTLVSAIVVEALKADYWKPVQAGYQDGTDLQLISSLVSNPQSKFYPEVYKLQFAGSPHIAARREGKHISLSVISEQYDLLKRDGARMVIEGAGGLLVPLNEKEFVIDLIENLGALVILVSRNYLGSINHSLLSAQVCTNYGLDVAGWIFNDQYLDYEDEIVKWSGYKKLGTVPKAAEINRAFVQEQAERLKQTLI